MSREMGAALECDLFQVPVSLCNYQRESLTQIPNLSPELPGF